MSKSMQKIPLNNWQDMVKCKGEKSFSEDSEGILTQAVLEFAEEARGVRFDAYIKSKNIWVEIEMQNYSGENIAKRSRYYQANMDMDALQKGKPYSKRPLRMLCLFVHMIIWGRMSLCIFSRITIIKIACH